MKRNLFTKGFTLIELLVVISIIGLLSSVVLASLSTARDKGRVAAGLQFASNIDRTANLGPVSFDFSGGLATNAQGTYNGTITGASASSDIPTSGMGGSLLFASGNYVMIDLPDTPAPIPTEYDIVDNGFMLSAWIKTTSSAAQNVISLGGNYSLVVNPTTPVAAPGGLRFAIHDGTTRQYLTTASGLISTGKWHHVAAKAERSNGIVTMYIYLDGKEVAKQNVTMAFGSEGDRYLCVGADASSVGCAGPFFIGYIDNPRFINYALSQ